MKSADEIYADYTSRKFDQKNKLNKAGKKKPTPDFLERLEAGTVEIEELDGLALPVFVYQTQLTIHGDFAGMSNTKAGGYRSLTVNKNASLGVKYCAIDASKKELIYDALRELKSGYSLYSDSSKCYVARSYATKAEALAEYHRLQIDSYLMKKQVYSSNYYGRISYTVYIGLFAIHTADVWPFLAHLDSAVTETAYTTTRAAREAARDAERAADKLTRDAAQAAAEQHFASVLAPFLNSKPVWNGKIPAEGIWLVRKHGVYNVLSIVFLKPKSKLWIERHFFTASKPLTKTPTEPTGPTKGKNIKPAEAAGMIGYRTL